MSDGSAIIGWPVGRINTCVLVVVVLTLCNFASYIFSQLARTTWSSGHHVLLLVARDPRHIIIASYCSDSMSLRLATLAMPLRRGMSVVELEAWSLKLEELVELVPVEMLMDRDQK